MKIAILEDNAERSAIMRDCLEDRFHQYETRFFDDVAEMIAFLDENLRDTIVLSLDHDLELKPGKAGRWIDPGTGRDLADYLAQRPPTCPVIIHTTNSVAAEGMELVLHDAGWTTHRVIPMEGNEWIPGPWFRSIRKAIVGSASPRRPKKHPTTGEQV
jgi:CheY-like chemotaxis protein